MSDDATRWLEARAAQAPDAPAIVFAGETVAYRSLAERAARLADALRRAGVGPGEGVAALLENGLVAPVLLWALRAIGAVLLPLSARHTERELVHPITDARARLVVHAGDALAPRARAAAARVPGVVAAGLDANGALSLEGPLSSEGRLPSADAPPDPLLADALALLYTSGTTGPPKGAVLGPEAFRASAEASQAWLGTGADDRWLACMPLFHVGGLSILVRSVLAGGAAHVQRGFDPVAVDRALDAEGITVVSLVAAMLERVLAVRGARPAPASLRCVLLGGGPTPAPLLARARDLGWPVAPTYGLTEATSQVATRRPDDDAPPLDGRLVPLPGTRLRIVDEAGRGLAPGEVGEITVRGGTLMRGYLGRPDATAAALRDGWLHTGDVGVLDEAGRLRVLDRRDDLIVSGGENVYPAEVEAVLTAHPAVAEAAVVGRPDARFGARPVALWVPVDPDAASPDLAAHCRAALAGYKVPVAFLRRASLPRNAAGKLLRRSLRDTLPRPGA